MAFVGFFPKDNPQLLALIIIDEPSTSGNQHFGGVSAAPVFKSVMNRIINIDSSIKVGKKRETKNINGKLKRSNQVLIQKNIELVVVPDLKNKHKGFLGLIRLSKELKFLEVENKLY